MIEDGEDGLGFPVNHVIHAMQGLCCVLVVVLRRLRERWMTVRPVAHLAVGRDGGKSRRLPYCVDSKGINRAFSLWLKS